MEKASQNTNREIWRKVSGDYYSPSIHITKDNDIGINVGGVVIVKPVEFWHQAAKEKLGIQDFKPKHTELDKDEVRKLWQSGEGMVQNPIKK